MRRLFSMIARMPRPARLALYALASGILLYMTLAPGKDVPGIEMFWDKSEHAIAWLVLTATGLVLSTRRRWMIGVFAFVFGAGIEVLQAVMPLGRDGEWQDLLSDCMGITAAYLIWWLLRRLGWVR
jgi:VanZ family protein